MVGKPRNSTTQKIMQTVRLDGELNERIAALASVENRSFSNMVETLLEHALADRSRGKKAA